MQSLLYLPPSSRQYRYHQARWDGATVAAAVEPLGLSQATGRDWQRQLRLRAARALDLPIDQVNYTRALRCLFEGKTERTER